jgi:hypothetical protein
MHKIDNIRKILVEGRLETVMGRYDEKYHDTIKKLSESDPSGNNKYLDWMVKNAIPSDERILARLVFSVQEIIDNVKCFHSNLNRITEKNINDAFKESNFQSLDEEQKKAIEKIKKSPKDLNSYSHLLWVKHLCEYLKELVPRNESRIKLFEDDRWLVVVPLTHQASCSYGAHSNWCVSTSNSSYFQNYTNNGVLIFFIDKKGNNPKKPNANMYKFALHVNLSRPDMNSWNWFSMEDVSIDPIFVHNVIPKKLLDVAKNYVEDTLKGLREKFKVNQEKLKECGLTFIFKQTNRDKQFAVIPDYSQFSDESLRSKLSYLIELSGRDLVSDIKNNKGNYVYFTVRETETNKPVVSTTTLPYKSYFGISSVTVTNSKLWERIFQLGLWSEVVRYIQNNGTEEQKEKLFQSVKNHINSSDNEIKQNTLVSQLQVGDEVIDYPSNSRWRGGEKVTVRRVAEKSILLSNGKRKSKSLTNTMEKVIGVIRVIDDPVVTETRHIIKKILKEYRY